MAAIPHPNSPPAESVYLLTTLAPWAAAFGARRCAGDDLLDELAAFGMPAVIVDAESGARTGWLELARSARSWSVRLPAPGAPDGLPPGPAAHAAGVVGEALVVDTGAAPLLVIPQRDPDRATGWIAHRPGGPVPPPAEMGLGEARLSLLDAIGGATAVLTSLPGASDGDAATLRAELAAQVSRFLPVLPPGAHARAAEVASLAAQVLATGALATARRASFGLAGAHSQEPDRRLAEVAAAARAALAASVNRVIDEYTRHAV
ncbi:hypothetical protein GCM10010528_28390 [Gordonia defluvii]|uniref:Uncharacterized protein n=1 Tax=Gordonia defluvii TaxID=283718 RepID=A0ABP6LPV8_9ACTN